MYDNAHFTSSNTSAYKMNLSNQFDENGREIYYWDN